MKVGVELDERVAQEVMGWKKIPIPHYYDAYGISWMWDRREGCLRREVQSCPRYSHEIEYAMEAANKRDLFNDHLLGKHWSGKWIVQDIRLKDKYLGETPAHAICLALLGIKSE